MKFYGMTLQHVGKKPEKAEKSTAPEPANPPEEYFPSLYLDGDQVPDGLKSAKHDDVVVLVARCRVASVGTHDGENGKRFNLNLELQDVGVKPHSKKKIAEMDEKEASEALADGYAEDDD